MRICADDGNPTRPSAQHPHVPRASPRSGQRHGAGRAISGISSHLSAHFRVGVELLDETHPVDDQTRPVAVHVREELPHALLPVHLRVAERGLRVDPVDGAAVDEDGNLQMGVLFVPSNEGKRAE